MPAGHPPVAQAGTLQGARTGNSGRAARLPRQRRRDVQGARFHGRRTASPPVVVTASVRFESPEYWLREARGRPRVLACLEGPQRALAERAPGLRASSRCSPGCARTPPGTPSPQSVPEDRRAAVGSGPDVSGRTGLACRTEDGRSCPALARSPHPARSSVTQCERVGQESHHLKTSVIRNVGWCPSRVRLISV
ncbi:hypothetical protein SMALB_3479 [Streptomyces malaysiensis]|uniref:Uncharacterized protein n=1 Tax=Streptomyces malaysiensis TaxID=92644 RepID=A0A7X6AX01_STRMQ|nr:hypothetical protein [Streptomyces malaysiensis]